MYTGIVVSMKGMTYASWLKNERALQKLSQSEVERKAEMGHSQYSKLERGEIRRPGEGVRGRIHAVFGTTDEHLVEAGVLEPKEYRSPDGSRTTITYEYVDAESEPAPAPATSTVAEAEPLYDDRLRAVVAEFGKIAWDEQRYAAIEAIVAELVRGSQIEAEQGSRTAASRHPAGSPIRQGYH